MKDTMFIWCPDSNYINIAENVFRKEKRIREIDSEDVVGKDHINIVFQVED
jgi:hypothetical protein